MRRSYGPVRRARRVVPHSVLSCCENGRTMKIAVIGATGLIGTKVVRALKADGHDVVALAGKHQRGEVAERRRGLTGQHALVDALRTRHGPKPLDRMHHRGTLAPCPPGSAVAQKPGFQIMR